MYFNICPTFLGLSLLESSLDVSDTGVSLAHCTRFPTDELGQVKYASKFDQKATLRFASREHAKLRPTEHCSKIYP